MQAFVDLYAALDSSTSTNDKLVALQRFFACNPPCDCAWAVYFLCGGKPKQLVPTAQLRALAIEASGISLWLFEESYQAVGDLAETISLVVPAAGLSVAPQPLTHWVEQRLLPMAQLRGEGADATRRELVLQAWHELDAAGRFVYIKLIGGGFRVGVSKLLVQRAIAAHFGVDAKRVAERMMGYANAIKTPGDWPDAQKFLALGQAESPDDQSAHKGGQPYPFFLAHALEPEVGADAQAMGAKLGGVGSWQVEWKFDGIRAQIVLRGSQVWIWSRGEELVTERFPEVVALCQQWPSDAALDGELLVAQIEDDGTIRPAPFAQLQQRIARKSVSKKLLAEVPVRFVAYDLLELAGVDLREQAQALRRNRLEAYALHCPGLAVSPVVGAESWAQLQHLRLESRGRGVEGFMLKQRDAAYGVGRRKTDIAGPPGFAGGWLKWKIEPMRVDCVLVYAQAGHGRRASLYTDYTFAVWSRPPRDAAEVQSVLDALESASKCGSKAQPVAADGLQLLPFAKAYSGLTDDEFKRVDAMIRKTTLDKFGPVRSVLPSLVFELGFEAISPSPRHKSGLAVRFPRMLRLRLDKPLHEADSMAELRQLLAMAPQAPSG